MSKPAPQASRVSTLELFFDLVFVFTITQLTFVLREQGSWRGLLQVGLMLGVIFWMYGGYAWLTNAVVPDRIVRRLVLLGGMAGFLVISLSIPQAFSGSGATFGIAYVVVVAIHLGMFARSSQLTVSEAILGLAPFNISTALMVLVGGILGGDAQYVLWGLALALEWISPKLIDDSGFEIQAEHFVERHGLVLIVAIGESVVAVGLGVFGTPVDAEVVVPAVLGLALAAALWWSYFGSDEDAAQEAMVGAEIRDRPQLAINAFGYAFMALLLGVIAIAAGLEAGIGNAFHPFVFQSSAVMLGGGAALFLFSEAMFRRVLDLGFVEGRLAAAVLAVATIPLGAEVGAVVQIGALVLVFAAMLAIQERELARIGRG